MPATTAAFDPPPPFWLAREELLCPLRELLCRPRELLGLLREDAEDVRRADALDLLPDLVPLALFALVPERGLLLDPVERLLLEPDDRLLPEPALFLLDDLLDELPAGAITPPWVVDKFGSTGSTPDRARKTRLGKAELEVSLQLEAASGGSWSDNCSSLNSRVEAVV